MALNHTPLQRKPFKAKRKPIRGKKHERTKATDIQPGVKPKVWERDHGRCVWCSTVYMAFPDAHFISRVDGGLGVEQNILTLCRRCHDMYDRGPIEKRNEMKRQFALYLSGRYEGWSERDLIYKRG
jgi:5-methylcytosine-specific restriction endonuclease McrA